MGPVLYFILLFSGLWTPAMCVARRFYVVEERKNWTEAQNYCRGIYTDLATIENQEDMDTVLHLVTENEKYWIGLKKNNNNNLVWSDGSNSTYIYWCCDMSTKHGTNDCEELQRDKLNDNCLHLQEQKTYKWKAESCSKRGPFICYKKIDLILVQQQLTWRKALSFCRQNYFDLVSVHTNETQDWVANVTKQANTSNVWMGLRYTCILHFWYWVSGESVCYQNWAPGNGTGVEDCSSGERTGAVQSGSNQWISLPETEELNFICTI